MAPEPVTPVTTRTPFATWGNRGNHTIVCEARLSSSLSFRLAENFPRHTSCGFSSMLACSKYQDFKNEQSERKSSSGQNGEHKPISKLGMRYRQREHVTWRVATVEEGRLASVPRSMRHDWTTSKIFFTVLFVLLRNVHKE